MTAMTTETENTFSAPPADPEMEEMLEAGAHLGHARAKRHPAMAPYIWGMRGSVEIIDLTKTKEKLAEALAFLRAGAAEGKMVLFVGGRPSTREILAGAAEALGYPSVSRRWIGGTLTNFRVVRKRIEYLETLEREQTSGGFEKYTKKEQLEKEREIARLRERFEGLRRLTRLPDALVILDISHDDLALREAKRIGVPVVALVDTNCDPRLVAYPIPANDDARPAIRYMLGRIKAAIEEGQARAKAAEAQAAAKAEAAAGAAAEAQAA